MLRLGMEINHVNDLGESAVQLAIMNGRGKIGAYLVEKDADVKFHGRTLLHEAAKRGMYACTLSLISRGINIDNVDNEKRTALHEAAQFNRPKCVRLLLDRSAGVNMKDDKENTALHYAAGAGGEESVALLMEAGADLSMKNSMDQTPWRCALVKEHTEVAQILRKHWSGMVGDKTKKTMAAVLPDEAKAAAVAAAANDDMETVQELLNVGAPIDVCDRATGNTILMGAAKSGSKRIIELCLRKGANINRRNNKGETCLHLAAPHPKIAEMMIRKGANITVKNKNGEVCSRGISTSPRTAVGHSNRCLASGGRARVRARGHAWCGGGGGGRVVCGEGARTHSTPLTTAPD